MSSGLTLADLAGSKQRNRIESLVKAGVGDADLGKNMKNALRASASGNGDDRSPKVRPIPGMDDYPMPTRVDWPEKEP